MIFHMMVTDMAIYEVLPGQNYFILILRVLKEILLRQDKKRNKEKKTLIIHKLKLKCTDAVINEWLITRSA